MDFRRIIVPLFFLFLLFFLALIVYFLFPDSPDSGTAPAVGGNSVTVGEQLGLDAVVRSQPEQISFGTISEAVEGDRRDDRVFIVSGDNTDSSAESVPDSRLVRLFSGPTAGYRVDQRSDGIWEVQVVEGGRGNRYLIRTSPYSLDLVSAGEFTKVLEGHIFSGNTTLVLFESDSGESIIRSAFVPFARSDTDTSLQYFEDNIRVVTNNDDTLFFLRDVDEGVVGLTVNVSDPKETELLWESSFTNWIPHWGRNSYITLSSPISSSIKGYVYLLDPEGDEPVIQATDIPSGGSALIDTTSGFFVLYEADAVELVGTTSITDQARQKRIPLPVTLPEKCDGFRGVFVCAVPIIIPAKTRSGHDTIFPDSWYQGDISFNDTLVLVNAVTGEKKLLMSPNQEDIRRLSDGAVFDIIHPRISEDGRFFFFVNRNDLSLWMLRL